MKNLFTALLLVVATFASAQIVNIPDSNFRNYLITQGIDTNSDSTIQISEALTVTNITIYSIGITDLTGIRSFTNLQAFACYSISITTLDLSNMTQLISITANDNQFLSSLNVSGCINLEYMICNNNLNTGVMDIVFGSIRKVRGLNFDDSRISELNLTLMDSLAGLGLGGVVGYAGIVDISGLTKIESLNQFGKIGSLIARGCTGLKFIHSQSGTSGIGDMLDVTGCINLESIYLYETNLTNLDLSTCPNFTNLFTYIISPGLEYLNIKNGSSATSLTIGNWGSPQGPPALNVCADDFEIASVSNMLNPFPIPVNISTNCSFFPGGNYNTIKGKLRLDLNSNGCDNADAGMGFVPLRMTDTSGSQVIRYSGSSGNYAHYPYRGMFTLTPYFPYPYFTIAPVSPVIVFDTANSLIDTVDFCISPNGVYNDLEITFLPSGAPARPGFDAGYQLVYKNRGTTTLSGTLQLNFDNSKMNPGYISPLFNNQGPGQLTWNYTNLLPFERRTILVTFNILPPPVNNINDTLIYLAAITPVANDETPFDNIFILPQRIRGSLDPNDKQCLEGSNISITEIDKFLHYIIRFQNLGTDTAFNIVVVDTLSNKLDWNSFEFIGSSHTCDVQQRNGKMEFFFQNINLPHSAINELASHGFVAFKIKPKSTVVIGDSLNNRAAIYFDFNLPVITNTATTIANPVGPVPVKLEYFFASAKGMSNQLTWKATCSEGSSTFNIERSADGFNFSKIGGITATNTRCQLPFYFTDSHPFTGKNYYRLKIIDVNGLSYHSKVVVVGYDKAGFEIVAIANNHQSITAYFNSEKRVLIHLKMVATDGKTIYADSKTIMAGNSQVEIPLKNIAAGVYTLIAYTDHSKIMSRRFIH